MDVSTANGSAEGRSEERTDGRTERESDLQRSPSPSHLLSLPENRRPLRSLAAAFLPPLLTESVWPRCRRREEARASPRPPPPPTASSSPPTAPRRRVSTRSAAPTSPLPTFNFLQDFLDIRERQDDTNTTSLFPFYFSPLAEWTRLSSSEPVSGRRRLVYLRGGTVISCQSRLRNFAADF